MENMIENYWNLRLEDMKKALESNNFEVFIAENTTGAKQIVLEEIVTKIRPKTVSWGGSMTFIASGLYDELMNTSGIEAIDTYDKNVSSEELLERRRHALLTDMFFTGTNAVTEMGQLVNLDMTGNRVAALAYGPKHVVILVGRNKIVYDLEEAMNRIKSYAAPVNAMRLDKKTPCVKTSYCEECKSVDRICNSWAITEKSYPSKRIKVVLINENLGI